MSNKHPKQVAETKYLNPIAEYLPIEKIANGLEVEVFELYIFEHFVEPSQEKMLQEINHILNNDSKLLKTIYKITNGLKNNN